MIDKNRLSAKINHRIFFVNVLWLFLITMMPFVTGVVGRSPDHTPTVLLFIAILVLQVLVQMVECRMIEDLNGIEIQDAQVVNRIRIITLIGCCIAAVSAIFAPRIAIIIVVMTSIFGVVLVWRYDKRYIRRN